MILYKENIKQNKKILINTLGEYIQKYIFDELKKDSIKTTIYKVNQINSYLKNLFISLKLKFIATNNNDGELVKAIILESYSPEEDWRVIQEAPIDMVLLDKLQLPEQILYYDENADS